MKLLSLTCNHCGAPLEVPKKTRYVTCDYCASRLEVHQSGGAVYTEVLEALEERTEQIAEDVETIKIQNELERLDREWTNDRQGYMIRGKDGHLSVPNKNTGVIMSLLVAAFGVFWTCIAGAMFPPMALFGIIFVVVAIFGGINQAKKADQYEQRRRTYRTRRQQILRDLAKRNA